MSSSSLCILALSTTSAIMLMRPESGTLGLNASALQDPALPGNMCDGGVFPGFRPGEAIPALSAATLVGRGVLGQSAACAAGGDLASATPDPTCRCNSPTLCRGERTPAGFRLGSEVPVLNLGDKATTTPCFGEEGATLHCGDDGPSNFAIGEPSLSDGLPPPTARMLLALGNSDGAEATLGPVIVKRGLNRARVSLHSSPRL